METIKAVLWDLDDSACYGWFNKETRYLQGQPMPGVVETIAHLQADNAEQAVLTNQAGILYALFQDEILQRNPTWQRKDYPTAQKLAAQIGASMKALGLTRIYVSIWDARLRWLLMPSEEEMQNFEHMPGSMSRLPIEQAEDEAKLFERLLRDQGLEAFVSVNINWRKPNPGMFDQALADMGITDRGSVYYVGDMDTDGQAAEAAGVNYVDANDIQSLLDETPSSVGIALVDGPGFPDGPQILQQPDTGSI